MAANNIYIQVDFNSQQAQQNVNALNQAIGQTGPVAQKSAAQATTAMGSMQIAVKQTTSAFGEMATALAGIGITRFISSMVDLSAEMNRAQQFMTAYAGSAAVGRDIIEQIRQVAKEGIFKVDDLLKAGQAMAAFGFEAKQIPIMLKVMTDQVTRLGGGIEQVNTLIRVFGRAMEKDFVGAGDALRAMPTLAVNVGKALQQALGTKNMDDVKKALKEGAIDPIQYINLIMHEMQNESKDAGLGINDAAKSFKNLGDEMRTAAAEFFGDKGFGPALTHLAKQISDLLEPLGRLSDKLKALPEPDKEWIVNITAIALAIGALSGALRILIAIGGPAITVIGALARAIWALVVALGAPEVLLVTGIATAIGVAILAFPEQAKKLEKVIGDFFSTMWTNIQSVMSYQVTKWFEDIGNKMKEFWEKAKGFYQDIFGGAKKTGVGLGGALETISKTPMEQLHPLDDVKQEVKFDELQKQVTEWSDNASKSILQALSSPVEAVAIKYKDLFDKLKEKFKEYYTSEEHQAELTAQLTAAMRMEMEAKLFEKEKKHIEDVAKLQEERVKGSYEAQIAYIEAMDAQDLRGKVAAVDQITDLRVESVKEVARIQDDALKKNFDNLELLLRAHTEDFAKLGLDVEQVINDRRTEMKEKQAQIDQKRIDETAKYYLEGWKKANDLIIEDQKRVFEGFKSIFDEIFDAFTDRSKSMGQAFADMFKKMALGEARELFSSQLAATATQAAGYGRPEEQLRRGGGFIASLFMRGLTPRPPLAPPELYKAGTAESAVQGIIQPTTDVIEDTVKKTFEPMVGWSQSFEVSTGEFGNTVVAFSQAVDDFRGAAGQHAQASVQMEGSADRMSDASDSMAGSADAFEAASAETGVSPTLLRAVGWTESHFRAGAVSPKGAMGIMQLMPATAKALGVTDPFNVSQNVMGGAKFLEHLMDKYGGDIPKVLAAYNMGEPRYDRLLARGGTLPKSVQSYVDTVQAAMVQGAVDQVAETLPQRQFELPEGFSRGPGGELSYTPPPLAAVTQPELPTPPALYGAYGAGMAQLGLAGMPSAAELGALTIAPTPVEAAQAAQPGALGVGLGGALGILRQLGGAAGGGAGAQQAGLGGLSRYAKLLNLSNLKGLFGIGTTATGTPLWRLGGGGVKGVGIPDVMGNIPGGTTFSGVLSSQGVGMLAGMGGMALISEGLRKRVAPVTVAGGALAGLGIGNQLGLPPGMSMIAGAGGGLFMAGVQRGGGAGLAMTTAGGAIAGAGIGFMFGGPMGALIGAGIGAGVGAITGVVRMFVKTETERIRQQIKQVYGIDISNVQLLAQIKQIVDTKYGGSVSVGIRSQDVQDIVRLYALSTGQAAMLPRPMYAATIAQSMQGMQLQPVYQGGVKVQNPYTGPTTYQYQTAITEAQGLRAGTSLGVPGASGLITQQWQQLALQTIQGNPSAIAMASAAAASAGDSRLTTTQAMQEPLSALP